MFPAGLCDTVTEMLPCTTQCVIGAGVMWDAGKLHLERSVVRHYLWSCLGWYLFTIPPLKENREAPDRSSLIILSSAFSHQKQEKFSRKLCIRYSCVFFFIFAHSRCHHLGKTMSELKSQFSRCRSSIFRVHSAFTTWKTGIWTFNQVFRESIRHRLWTSTLDCPISTLGLSTISKLREVKPYLILQGAVILSPLGVWLLLSICFL